MDAHKTETTSITFPALQARARALAASGGSGTLVAGTITGAISDLRAALARQVDSHLQLGSEREALALIDPADPAAPALDISEFLGGTSEAAALRAHSMGHTKPSNAARRVARLLDVLGVLAVRAPHALHAGALPTAWTRLASVVADAAASDTPKNVRQRKAVATAVRYLGQKATSRGVISPWDLPQSYVALCATLKSWGMKNPAHIVWALRRAGEYVAAVPQDLDALPSWKRESPGEKARERVRTAMPLFHEDLEAWAEQATTAVTSRDLKSRSQSAHEPLRPKTMRRYTSQAFQWANALLDLHERGALDADLDPATLTCETAWTTSVQHEGGAQRHASRSDRVIARRRREGMRSTPPLALHHCARLRSSSRRWRSTTATSGVGPSVQCPVFCQRA